MIAMVTKASAAASLPAAAEQAPEVETPLAFMALRSQLYGRNAIGAASGTCCVVHGVYVRTKACMEPDSCTKSPPYQSKILLKKRLPLPSGPRFFVGFKSHLRIALVA